ncbi:MAG: histidine phosphatase family protein [Acidimicrobiales bacterium]
MTWATQPPPGLRTVGDVATGTRLVLVRHGEAECNARGTIGGPLGCGGLTDLGRAQAGALVERLARTRELDDVTALYTSVLPRAVQTAALLATGLPAGLEARADCELCELHPGEADGLTWPEFVDRYGVPDWANDPGAPLAPGGESWIGFYERCTGAFARLVARHAGERVVLVVHGGVVEQAMKAVLDVQPGDRLRLMTQNCSMTEIEYDAGRARLLRYNDVAPLPAA